MINQRVPVSIIPENDLIRLKKLEQFELSDTNLEPDFDTVAVLAAEIFETSNARISFIAKDHIFYKSDPWTMERVAREDSLCALSILNEGVTVYEDIYNFGDLPDSIYLLGEGIRFYAAAPIITIDGFALGTVSVSDREPRSVSTQQTKMLQSLAALVMEKLEDKLAAKISRNQYCDKLRHLAHDMKNPVTTISLYAQLLSTREMSTEKVTSMATKIEKSSRILEDNLNKLSCQD